MSVQTNPTTSGSAYTQATSGGIPLTGSYGTLTLKSDGSYTYKLNPTSTSVTGNQEVFTYKLVQADGDFDTATLTINLGASAYTAPTAVTGATAGADTITGTNGNDLIQGLAGNDILGGNAGSDHIEGGGGNDVITGGAGIDFLIGGSGADTFKYTSFSEIVTGEKIADFSSLDGDKVDFGALLASATALENRITINPTDGASSHDVLSMTVGGTTYILDVNNVNPNSAVAGGTYIELDSEKLLGDATGSTKNSWTDVVDITSATGFQGTTGVASITGDGWTVKVLDAGITYTQTQSASEITFKNGANAASNVHVEITTSDGVVHDVANVDKIQWHG